MAVLWSYFAVEDYAELRENKSCGLYDHLACFRLDVCDGGGHLGLGGAAKNNTFGGSTLGFTHAACVAIDAHGLPTVRLRQLQLPIRWLECIF